MHRFAQLILIATGMVAMFNADPRPESRDCTFEVRPAFESTGIQYLELEYIRENDVSFYPKEQGTWSFQWNDVLSPDNAVSTLMVKPVSKDDSKFEASVEIESVTVQCNYHTIKPLKALEMKFCPKSNPVEIKLNESIPFVPCE